MRYLDLMGGAKPYLLTGMRNNLGAQTRVHYTPSTEFYLADQAAGNPWLTRLPFPVHVVDRVTVDDRISGNQLTTTYSYRDGYFDPVEREFRGFGMVEQTDAEHLDALNPDTPAATSNLDPAHSVPPTRTRTWFHTGVYHPDLPLSRLYEADYWREPTPGGGHVSNARLKAMMPADTALPDTVQLPDGNRAPHQLSVAEAREAARALKGSVLRQEIYADDDTDAAERPYEVVEHNYTLELLQPLTDQRHAVCVTHPRETVTFAYERALYDPPHENGRTPVPDPRVTHEVTLDVDPYGNPLRTAAVAYPRRYPDPAADLDELADTRAALHTAQAQLLLTSTDTVYTNLIDDGTSYRTPQPAATRAFELLHLTPRRHHPLVTNLFTLNELRAELDAASDGYHDLPYEDVDHTGATNPTAPYRRLLHHARTLYEADNLSGPLLPGQLGARGLVHAHYTLAFTPGLLAAAFQRTRHGQTENLLPEPDRPAVLGGEGGYLSGDQLFSGGTAGQWWLPSGQVHYSPDPSDGPPQELAYARAHFFLPRRLIDAFVQTTTVTYDDYDLLVADVQDPIGNRTSVGARDKHDRIVTGGQDYRVLQPWLVSDPNRNRTAVAYDALGLVAGTAVMGKTDGPVEGDTLDGFIPDLEDAIITDYLAHPTRNPQALLGGATTRVVYDLNAYKRSTTNPEPAPVVAAALARETHSSDLPGGRRTRVLQTLVYSDGFSRDIQHKTLAAPGPLTGPGSSAEVNPRWVGSGWTIYNNKGKPVRQYEPFFTATPAFEFDWQVGVSAVLFYDPLDRTVATYQPNDTYSKTLFDDPWAQVSWDVNDTVLLDPRTDPDVEQQMAAYLATLPDPHTWYTRRASGALGTDEQDAATKTQVHAATPTRTYHDPLGRAMITLEHNRYTRTDLATGATATIDERYPTRLVLDIDGNQRAVIDPLGRTAARTTYGPGQRTLKTTSADAGDTITLTDVTTKPIRMFDSRGHTTRTTYDPARRPLRTYVRLNTNPWALRVRLVYGDSAAVSDDTANLRTRIYRQFDGVGVLTTNRHDFKGNPTETRRRLAIAYREQLDWALTIETSPDQDLITALPDGVLEPDDYTTHTSFDALNHITITTTPDDSVTRNTYDEAGLPLTVAVQLHGAVDDQALPVWTAYVTGITYNPRAQRLTVATGNNVTTAYSYDVETFRLTQLVTRRDPSAFPDDCPHPPAPPCGVQNLTYTYDPTGNITRLTDAAQQRIFYNNTVVDPTNDYTYDALYRLATAKGREHIGQADTPQTTWNDIGRTNLAMPGDGQKMRRYTEFYDYDAVGNMFRLGHAAPTLLWTRTFQYHEPSAVDPTEINNQLSTSTIARAGLGTLTEMYTYDAHGNTISMPHLEVIEWDDREQLHGANMGGGGAVYHTFDAAGQRVRKVVDGQNGTRQHERIYLNGYEIYRKYNGGGADTNLAWQTLQVKGGRPPSLDHRNKNGRRRRRPIAGHPIPI